MTIAVNLFINKGGDDDKQNRLLTYLKHTLPFSVEKIEIIRPHVYKISSIDRQYIIKRFPSLRRLKIQEDFTDSLKKEGFFQTYSFLSEINLFFESQYYGCMEYIEPGEHPFYYDTKENCREGLELLNRFHETTQKLTGNYKHNLPTFHLIEKWQARYLLFKKNVPLLSFFLQQNVISDLLSWGEWSLNGLKLEYDTFSRLPKVILHGDVAYHNFLRTSNNELLLIDFDLISIGSAINDYLQYANRIFPFFDWKVRALIEFSILQPYFQEKFFLYALAFPSDVFREWNRLIKEHNYYNADKIRPLMELTVGQFEKRKAYFDNLVTMIRDGEI